MFATINLSQICCDTLYYPLAHFIGAQNVRTSPLPGHIQPEFQKLEHL